MKILVINGPNLGRLGLRQPEVYGSLTLADVEERVTAYSQGQGVELKWQQSDNEADLLGWIHQAADDNTPVIINAGGLTHTSVILRDALAEVANKAGFIEVHLSNVHAREEFRHVSLLSPIACGVIAGLGVVGYESAVDFFVDKQKQQP